MATRTPAHLVHPNKARTCPACESTNYPQPVSNGNPMQVKWIVGERCGRRFAKRERRQAPISHA